MVLPDLRIQEEEDSQWAEYVPGTTKPVDGQKYQELASIEEALSGRETILLKGTWMRLCGDGQRGVLPRRQDLPAEEEPTWEPLPCLRLVARCRVLIVAVSYCWATPEHPDPHGEQLRGLTRMIRLRLEEERLPLEDLAVFFDWCSLYQRPRADEIEAIFKRSLAAVNLWYSHARVMCWLLTRVPEGVVPYERRGWPTFEQGISCFIKDGSKVLDLGKMDEALSLIHI